MNDMTILLRALQESNDTLHKQVALLQQTLAAANISTDPAHANKRGVAGAGIAEDASSFLILVIAITLLSCATIAGLVALSRALYCSCGCNRQHEKEPLVSDQPSPASSSPPTAAPVEHGRTESVPDTQDHAATTRETNAVFRHAAPSQESYEMAVFNHPPNTPFDHHRQDTPLHSSDRMQTQPVPSNSPFSQPNCSPAHGPFGQPPSRDSPFYDGPSNNVQAEPMPPMPPGARRALRTKSMEPNPFDEMDV
jgi:hypothetical protein